MKLSGTVGAAQEGEIGRVWARAVGEGPAVSLEESGGYGDLTGREAGGGSHVTWEEQCDRYYLWV